jgi:nucleoside-diphosphate-sugar epimerase
MRALVIGGSGFVGASLVAGLTERGTAARAVLRDRVPIAPSQIRMSNAAIYANGQKALREFGLSQTPFKSAVERACDWYREHGYIRQPKL